MAYRVDPTQGYGYVVHGSVWTLIKEVARFNVRLQYPPQADQWKAWDTDEFFISDHHSPGGVEPYALSCSRYIANMYPTYFEPKEST
jgi:hypothetical protein